jgi:Tol biopolymer transport system component
MFVVNVNGTGLKQITPAGLDFSSSGDWSPQGNEIVFSQHLTPDVHSSIWVVHSDGSGLHEINVQPASACGGANADPAAQGCNHTMWSPDGTKIAFVRSHLNIVDGEVYTVNLDGTGLTQITHTTMVDSVDWGTGLPIG